MSLILILILVESRNKESGRMIWSQVIMGLIFSDSIQDMSGHEDW
jgi:hypothetical protein